MLILAWNNIRRRRSQSAITVAITFVTIMIFVIVFGVLQVMQQGLELSRERLGADAVLIPKYASTQGDELLFTAEPENIYMSVDVYEQAKSLKGIEKMSPQFYAQTLALDCCGTGEDLRLIGIDPATDFVLSPYLDDGYVQNMQKMDLILGNAMYSEIVGYNYLILGKELFAARQLPVTGTGMDHTLFMEIDTCRQLCLESSFLNEDWIGIDPYEQISVIMLRLEEGVDHAEFEKQVKDSGIEARCVFTSDTISALQEQIDVIIKVIFALWIGAMIISILALFGRFNSLAKERKKEIGLLRALGVKKGQIFVLVMAECGIMAALGGIMGSIAALLSMNYVIEFLREAFMLSGAVWGTELAVLCGGSGVVLAVVLGFLSALTPALKSAELDPQIAITQGEI